MSLQILPCIDSPDMGLVRRSELQIPRDKAAELGRSAVEAARRGLYIDARGDTVNWHAQVVDARSSKRSIPPDASLPVSPPRLYSITRIQVSNETTLQAARRLTEKGLKPLALNFANGVAPGGGFLSGALAQEEVLCRSSALFVTLEDDPMYEAHRRRPRPDSTAWCILSPDVPVFRLDDGTTLKHPWLASFLTCAAPYVPAIGQPASGDMLRARITRVLAVASAFGYEALVLGAWGCGAFRNNPQRTASDFREALESEFAGRFSEIVFAITDWSPERQFLGPFRDVFS